MPSPKFMSALIFKSYDAKNTTAQIIDDLEKINEKYKQSLPGDFTATMKKSAKEHGLYLGCYKRLGPGSSAKQDEQNEHIHYTFTAELLGANRITYKKSAIPIELRKQVVKNYFGDKSTSACVCCDSPLNILDAHCGHIVAEFNGGATTADNLVPVCQSCNSSMKTMNLYEFRDKYYPKK